MLLIAEGAPDETSGLLVHLDDKRRVLRRVAQVGQGPAERQRLAAEPGVEPTHQRVDEGFEIGPAEAQVNELVLDYYRIFLLIEPD